LALPIISLPFDGELHRAEHRRDMRSIGNKATFRVNKRAAKVEALFDVDRHCRLLEYSTHLLRYSHEAMTKD
jgi:hypothetical protein